MHGPAGPRTLGVFGLPQYSRPLPLQGEDYGWMSFAQRSQSSPNGEHQLLTLTC